MWLRKSRPGKGRLSVAPPRPEPREALPDRLGEVEFAIAQTAEWIRGADTKAGFTLTALVLLLGAVAGDASSVRALWTKGVDAPLSLWLLAVSIVTIGAALITAALVVLPRTPSPRANRFSWPWLANSTFEEVTGRLGTDAREEAWYQAWTLARVARDKHRRLRVAMSLGFVAAACFFGWKTFFS